MPINKNQATEKYKTVISHCMDAQHWINNKTFNMINKILNSTQENQQQKLYNEVLKEYGDYKKIPEEVINVLIKKELIPETELIKILENTTNENCLQVLCSENLSKKDIVDYILKRLENHQTILNEYYKENQKTSNDQVFCQYAIDKIATNLFNNKNTNIDINFVLKHTSEHLAVKAYIDNNKLSNNELLNIVNNDKLEDFVRDSALKYMTNIPSVEKMTRNMKMENYAEIVKDLFAEESNSQEKKEAIRKLIVTSRDPENKLLPELEVDMVNQIMHEYKEDMESVVVSLAKNTKNPSTLIELVAKIKEPRIINAVIQNEHFPLESAKELFQSTWKQAQSDIKSLKGIFISEQQKLDTMLKQKKIVETINKQTYQEMLDAKNYLIDESLASSPYVNKDILKKIQKESESNMAQVLATTNLMLTEKNCSTENKEQFMKLINTALYNQQNSYFRKNTKNQIMINEVSVKMNLDKKSYDAMCKAITYAITNTKSLYYKSTAKQSLIAMQKYIDNKFNETINDKNIKYKNNEKLIRDAQKYISQTSLLKTKVEFYEFLNKNGDSCEKCLQELESRIKNGDIKKEQLTNNLKERYKELLTTNKEELQCAR